MKCNICSADNFIDFRSRKKAQCNNCGSLERTRLMWLYINRYRINHNSKILHIAPEKCTFRQLSKITSEENYITADLFPEKHYHIDKNCKKIDLCNLDDEESNKFDFIFHSHVIEHIPCNIAYTLFHLHRMLKKSGRHICVIPFTNGRYDESYQNLSGEERKKRFGQSDHVRRIGSDDIDKHVGCILNLPKEYDATKLFSVKILKEYNIPDKFWKGFHMSTVLDLNKDDYRLKG